MANLQHQPQSSAGVLVANQAEDIRSHAGPSLLAQAIVHTLLVVASIVSGMLLKLGATVVNPYSHAEDARRLFADNPVAIRVSWCQSWSTMGADFAESRSGNEGASRPCGRVRYLQPAALHAVFEACPQWLCQRASSSPGDARYQYTAAANTDSSASHSAAKRKGIIESSVEKSTVSVWISHRGHLLIKRPCSAANRRWVESWPT